VPNQWSADGAARALSGSVASGACGAIISPKTAHDTQKATTIVPATNALERRSCRTFSWRAARRTPPSDQGGAETGPVTGAPTADDAPWGARGSSGPDRPERP